MRSKPSLQAGTTTAAASKSPPSIHSLNNSAWSSVNKQPPEIDFAFATWLAPQIRPGECDHLLVW
jgi:hypothetical protein